MGITNLKMTREITTDPLSVEDLWSDLRINIDLMKDLGVIEVLVMFGFSWGKFIYKKEWKEINVSVDEIKNLVTDAESKEYGMLGDDNLYITIPDFTAKLLYSYETDIHLSYSEKNEFVETIINRWSSNDWFIESKKSDSSNLVIL